MACYSDKTTWNALVKLAEQSRGTLAFRRCSRSKLISTGSEFHKTYDSVEKLRRGEITELPSHKSAYSFVPKSVLQAIQSKFGLYVAYGMFDFPEKGSLNQLFPDIKTTTVEQVISH